MPTRLALVSYRGPRALGLEPEHIQASLVSRYQLIVRKCAAAAFHSCPIDEHPLTGSLRTLPIRLFQTRRYNSLFTYIFLLK